MDSLLAKVIRFHFEAPGFPGFSSKGWNSWIFYGSSVGCVSYVVLSNKYNSRATKIIHRISCYLDPTSLFIHCEGHFVDTVTNGVTFYPVITILSALRGHAFDNSHFQEVDLEPFSVTIGSHTPRVDTVQATIPGGITGTVISRSRQTTRWDSIVFHAQRHNTAIWISKLREAVKENFSFSHGHSIEKFSAQELNAQRICLRDNMPAISLFCGTKTWPPWRHAITFKHWKHCPYTKILTLLTLCVGVTKCFSDVNQTKTQSSKW